MNEITPIRLGDTVYCADYDSEQREHCWINGLTVNGFEDDDDRAVCESGPPGHSHRVFLLRHEGERNRTPSEG